MLRILLALVFSVSAMAADLDRAPEAFAFQSGKAIYVDFTSANYAITYDITNKTASVVATIEFDAPEDGYPLFDVKVDATSAKLDGVSTTVASLKTPDNATTLKALTTIASEGHHVMVISVPLTTLVDWNNGGVHSATWTTDLNDRGYLEQYMPANMEFDRVPMTFDVTYLGMSKKQIIYTNGEQQQLAPNRVRVTFPEHFTSSSMFFHTVPEGVMSELRFTISSIDGRQLPAVVYLKPGFLGGPEAKLQQLKEEATKVIAELENDYGPFLHQSVTIYNAGSGGMEYCGATMTSLSALGHELTHSYFARGIMPANGNAGWIDEALASWRDNGYPRGNGFSGSANMAGRANYTRYTDRQAYTYGATFMSNLDNMFASQGGLKTLLRELVTHHHFEPYFTEDFVGWAEGHYRTSLMSIFKERVYKSGGWKEAPAPSVHHQKLSIEELAKLL